MITKGQLKGYLADKPLMEAIRAKDGLNRTKRELAEAELVMGTTGISDEAVEEVAKKAELYQKLANNYRIMIEESWGLTWQTQHILQKYMDKTMDEVDQLPSQLG